MSAPSPGYLRGMKRAGERAVARREAIQREAERVAAALAGNASVSFDVRALAAICIAARLDSPSVTIPRGVRKSAAYLAHTIEQGTAFSDSEIASVLAVLKGRWAEVLEALTVGASDG